MFLLASTHLYAFGTIETGYRVDKSTTVTIDAWGECREVVNNSGNDYFVPTKTAAEWQSFRDHPPSGVALNTCCVSGSQSFTTPGEHSFVIDSGKKDCRFRITVKGAGGGSNYFSGGIGGGAQFTFAPGTTGTFGIYVGGKGTDDGNVSIGGGAAVYAGYRGSGGGGASAIKFGSTVLTVSGGGGGCGGGSGCQNNMLGDGGNGGSLNAPGDGKGGANIPSVSYGSGGQNIVAEGSKDGGNGHNGTPGGISISAYTISGGGGGGAFGNSGGGGGGGYGGGGGGGRSGGTGGASYGLYAYSPNTTVTLVAIDDSNGVYSDGIGYMDINSYINSYISVKNGNGSGGAGDPVWPPPDSAPGSPWSGGSSRGRWGSDRDADNSDNSSGRNGGVTNEYSSGSNNLLLVGRPCPAGGGGGGGGGYLNTGMGLTSVSAVSGAAPDSNGEVTIEWFK